MQSNKTPKRVGYIDVLKGFAILAVIWFHANYTTVWGMDPGTFGNITFFVLSGIFFKVTDFKRFATTRAMKILLPFLVFYILSYPFRLLVEFWDIRSLQGLSYSMIWDVFKIQADNSYLYANVPLWFLLAILIVQLIGLAVFRLPKWAVLVVAVMVIFFKEEIMSVPTPLMINKGIHWFGFFAIGYLLGKPVIQYLSIRKNRYIGLLVSLLILFFATVWTTHHYFDLNNMMVWIQYLALIMVLLVIASFFEGMRVVAFLEYLGVNTLVILCAHVWFLTPIIRVVGKLGCASWQMGILMAIVCAVIMIPFINFVNKRLPILAGK